MDKKVVIYSTPTCHFCHMAKDFFKENNVPFEDIETVVFKSNKHNEYPQKIFDTGIVFRKNKNTETNVEEITTLAVGSSHATTDFTEIKQILDYLLNMLNIEYKIIEHEHPSFITGRIGEIIIRDKKMGVIGEISPQVLENFGLETPVSAFELDLNELFNVMRH